LAARRTDIFQRAQRFVVGQSRERAACKKHSLPLVWCPVAMMTTTPRVFMHIIRPGLKIVAAQGAISSRIKAALFLRGSEELRAAPALL
jgi:hypothetical protein